jgi:glycosyltransferase involved in cell wall biosynthesis
MGAGEVDAVHRSASRRRFPMLDELPPDAMLIGVFGFLNEYKGIGTAIQALQYLPPNHHLLIFGGIHPQEIVPRQPRHPYISSLFDGAYMDTTLYEQLNGSRAQGAPPLVIAADKGLRELLGTHPRDLSARIHFMGALGEADFLSGMTICEAVVFPYLEVGNLFSFSNHLCRRTAENRPLTNNDIRVKWKTLGCFPYAHRARKRSRKQFALATMPFSVSA